ncbi:MAG: hypothetical protein U5L96_05260 [Owenweeksia sp.]|nr:hypothetical protein [Owenweeksia sp.]
MHPILRNVLAVIAGAVVGGVVNMAIITYGGALVPLPEGVDPTNMDSLKENMHRFTPLNFLVPFLAHAAGTLVGALIAALLAVGRKMPMALIVGVFFLLGGVANVFMLPAPGWFIAVDLVLAYLPMAWLGGRLARGLSSR